MGKPKLVAVTVPRSRWDQESLRAWLKKKGVEIMSIEEAGEEITATICEKVMPETLRRGPKGMKLLLGRVQASRPWYDIPIDELLFGGAE